MDNEEQPLIHPRDPDNHDDQRNVRPHLEIARVGSFRPPILLSVPNMSVLQGRIAGVINANRFNPNCVIVSLQTHLRDGPQDLGVIVAIVLGISRPEKEGKGSQIQRRQGAYHGSSTPARYNRRLLLMCLASDVGSNTFMMFQGASYYEKLLDGDLSLRDNGGLRPGSVVLLQNPLRVDTFLSGGSIPIINVSRPLLILDDNFIYPERPIISSGTDACGSILHQVKVTVETVDILDLPCDGRLCDQQVWSNVDANMHQHCACIQMNHSGTVGLRWGVQVQCPDGSFFTTHFMSKFFNIEYIFTEELPSTIKGTSFSHHIIDRRLLLAGKNICNYINERGGFVIIMWVKRGEVLDQGVDQPNAGLPYNAPKTMMESGTLIHHIVRLLPQNPESINLNELQLLRFDTTTGFHLE